MLAARRNHSASNLTVTLPRHRGAPFMFVSHGRPTVLCVDDLDSGLIIRKLFLESNGYHVLTARGGVEGLETLENRQVEAVVLDYRMPEMDGAEVAHLIKQKRPALPIILLSGYISELPEGVRDKVDALIIKGSPPTQLLDALEKVLGWKPAPRPLSEPAVIEHSREHADQIRDHVAQAEEHVKKAKKVVSENRERRRPGRKGAA